jgi:hypothetical protein
LNRTSDALFKRLKQINEVDYRPACYKDFEEFEVDGNLYRLKRRTLRNKFSVLKKEGRIERYYNSRGGMQQESAIRHSKSNIYQFDNCFQ